MDKVVILLQDNHAIVCRKGGAAFTPADNWEELESWARTVTKVATFGGPYCEHGAIFWDAPKAMVAQARFGSGLRFEAH